MIDFKDQLEARFVRYAKIGTTSNSEVAATLRPSTKEQWDLINLLIDELKEMGIKDIYSDNKGYIIARIHGNCNSQSLGFMAHVDTSSDSPGMDVKPQLHRNYDGSVIKLKDGVIIDPNKDTDLLLYKGETIVTSDGTTLLGADDKAGMAAIMEMAKWFLDNPDEKHGPIEIIFTPDEETGRGMDDFPFKELQSSVCYSVDAGREGEIEMECYNAWSVTVDFTGIAIHPGYARGEMVNAASMAVSFMNMIPRSESPEATDGRYGNYWCHSIEGSIESAKVELKIRDFDIDQIERRIEAIEAFAKATEAAFPGGKAEVSTRQEYLNMFQKISETPDVFRNLEKALEMSGVEADPKLIRGGTDGSRLTAMGVPTPNIFAGGHNFHSRKEWVALPAINNSCKVLINLIKKWAE